MTKKKLAKLLTISVLAVGILRWLQECRLQLAVMRHRDANTATPAVRNQENRELENVAIANALHMRQPDAAQSLSSALISSPVPSLKSLSLSIAVLRAFLLLIRYVTV